MNTAWIDAWRLQGRRKSVLRRETLSLEYARAELPEGSVFYRDTGGELPPVMIIPDGPNVIAHYDALVEKLRDKVRLIIFDLPGFGFSYPNSNYDFSVPKTRELVVRMLDHLQLDQATLAFSCANGFYGLGTAKKYPDRVKSLLLSQTPSVGQIRQWTERIVPKVLRTPLIGQLVMARSEKKFAHVWYKYSLPKGTNLRPWRKTALDNLNQKGCYCLASLTMGLQKMTPEMVSGVDVPTTLLYGDTDFSHRDTDFHSISEHAPHAEIVHLPGCGHFPDLERMDDFEQAVTKRIL
ncbi:MAG: alpha/beta hydrolase [Bacteroidota bacterium]